MSGLKILFLSSGDQLCRCLIAKNILQSFDAEMEVYPAGMAPIAELSEERKRAMSQLGYEIGEDDVRTFDEYRDMEFDYLITLSPGIREQLKKYPINYKIKLHMEFTDFCAGETTESEAVKLFRKIQEEIQNELSYFYYHILKGQDSS